MSHLINLIIMIAIYVIAFFTGVALKNYLNQEEIKKGREAMALIEACEFTIPRNQFCDIVAIETSLIERTWPIEAVEEVEQEYK